MIRHRFSTGSLISLRSGPGHQRTEGTWLLTRLALPIKAVALSLGADKLLGILKQLVAIRVALIVLALRIHDSERHLYNIQLIAPDAPVDYFLFASLSIKSPPSPFLDKRNRKRPFILSHLQDHLRFT